jgi:hypothetical protein
MLPENAKQRFAATSAKTVGTLAGPMLARPDDGSFRQLAPSSQDDLAARGCCMMLRSFREGRLCAIATGEVSSGARAASLSAAGAFATSAFALQSTDKPSDKPKVYTCPPCGCPNDGKEFPAPGACSVCAMPLVEKPAVPPAGQQPSRPTDKSPEPNKASPAERPSPE